jgi:hypothetical protein
MGALIFAFVDPEHAREWVDDYYGTLARDCTPIGHAVNAAVAVVTGLSCHRDSDEARRRGLDGLRFFAYGIGHHYVFGGHRPGRTNVWERFETARSTMDAVAAGAGGVGNPAEITAHLRRFADAGVDQVIFIQQAGRTKHRHICESLELFANEVMPAFRTDESARARRLDAIEPAIEAALRRRPAPAPLADHAIPIIEAYGRPIAGIVDD